MAKTKILVFTESFLPSIGGLENNTLMLCNTLNNLGYEVTLLTPQSNATKQPNFLVIESVNKTEYFKQAYLHHLVIINGGIAFKMILPCLLLFKKYLVIYQMATLYKNLHAYTFVAKALNQLRFILAKCATLNIGVSNYSYQTLFKRFGNKSKLLINPADPNFENNLHQKNFSYPFLCLIGGRLIEGKGIFLLIEAIKELNLEDHPVQLYIIGDGPAKEDIIKSDSSIFHYHPPVSKVQLLEWFKKVHLTIIPSTHHIEGSPLIMAESLLAGTPVLVSSQPAMEEAIQHEDLVFKNGDINSLKEKIKKLMNEAYYSDILKHCKSISSKFTYPEYINSLDLIIKKYV